MPPDTEGEFDVVHQPAAAVSMHPLPVTLVPVADIRWCRLLPTPERGLV